MTEFSWEHVYDSDQDSMDASVRKILGCDSMADANVSSTGKLIGVPTAWCSASPLWRFGIGHWLSFSVWRYTDLEAVRHYTEFRLQLGRLDSNSSKG